MTTFSFRPAMKSEAKPLIGLYAESGKGKTYSALLLACGFVGGDMSKVGMIETESGRGEAFAGDPKVGGYHVLPLRDDFSPKNYGAAIKAAESANLKALIIDSASHEWEGAGGVLAMAATNQKDGKKGPLVWQGPKIDHSREFMLRLMQTPIPLVIVCMRAKYPMIQITQEYARAHPGAKVGEWARDTNLSPKQSEDILYEMFVHGWIDDEHRFHGTKYTLDELRKVIEDGKPITEESGRKLAQWAAGGKPKAEAQAPGSASPGASASPDVVAPPAASAPVQSATGADDMQRFLDGEIDVDAETVEITTPRSRSIKFDLPGSTKPPEVCPSPDAWLVLWNDMADKIVNSEKLSPTTKEAKLRALHKANVEHLKAAGGMLGAKVQADVATRVKAIKAAEEATQ